MTGSLSSKGIAPAENSPYYICNMSIPNKTLVIRLSSIGDIVLASPLIRVLRKQFPFSQIDFVVRKEYAELVRNNKNLNHIVEFDAKTGFSGLCKLKNQLRAEQYDFVIDIHNSLRSRYLRWMLRAGDVVVFHKRIFARTMLIQFKKNFYRSAVSVADRYIESVQKYGVTNDGMGLELYIPDEIRTEALTKLKKLGIRESGTMIGFCPSAKHATKCWPQERFAELGIKLSADDKAKILLFGGSEDKEKCLAIADAINSFNGEGSAADLSGEFSLLESAIAMEACSLIVTNDSGLMHIACAMKKKVIAIFGSTVREFGFFPVGTESVVVERTGLYCRPCSHIGRSTCPEGHFRCMKEIQVDELVASIKSLIDSKELSDFKG
jgi:lipopolysaccharide heptosyltransferase II